MFKILVVEDDKDLNRTVCAFLSASGYEATARLTYPVYNRVLQKQRERIAPEILRLTDELLK